MGLTSLIHHYDVEGVLGLGEREHRPHQWTRVQGTLQIGIRIVRQRIDPTLEQRNKQKIEGGIFLAIQKPVQTVC